MSNKVGSPDEQRSFCSRHGVDPISPTMTACRVRIFCQRDLFQSMTNDETATSPHVLFLVKVTQTAADTGLRNA
eukprot:scaffold2107_cov192-Alexandrium_tamarense.AAC.60